MTPGWLKLTIETIYGVSIEIDREEIKNFRDLTIRELVPAIWTGVLNRFGSEPRPAPECLVVDSPSAKPISMRRDSDEYFVLDLHLDWLLRGLTILGYSEPSADHYNSMTYAIYAERSYVAGRLGTARLFAKKAKLLQERQAYRLLRKDAVDKSMGMAYIQYAFIIAHELGHLAFRADPERAKRLMREHSSSMTDVLTHVDETLDRSQGGRRYTHAQLDHIRELGRRGLWKRASESEIFAEECLADSIALSCMFGTMSRDIPKEFLVLGARLALHNVAFLQFLDSIAASKKVVSVVESTNQDYWLANLRVMGLQWWAAAGFLNDGDTASVARMDTVLSPISDEYVSKLQGPLKAIVDFNLLEHYPEFRDGIVEGRDEDLDPDDILALLGFGDATERASGRWYFNFAVAEPDPSETQR